MPIGTILKLSKNVFSIVTAPSPWSQKVNLTLEDIVATHTENTVIVTVTELNVIKQYTYFTNQYLCSEEVGSANFDLILGTIKKKNQTKHGKLDATNAYTQLDTSAKAKTQELTHN